jgi:hypothetical protein
MILRVHIEELLVDGIALGLDGERDFIKAIRMRLIELLTQPACAREIAPRKIALPPHSDATALGTRVAESVHPDLPGVALGESP